MARLPDSPSAQAQLPADVQEELYCLASALLVRTDELIEAVTRRAQRQREREGAAELDPAVEDAFVRLGTLASGAVARWLGGESVEAAVAAGEEFSRFFARLAASSDVPLGEVLRRCRCWRDGCERELAEAAGEGLAAEEALRRARESIRTAADHALAQMSAIFDGERRRVKEELARRQAELSFLATHDALTGLANRPLICEGLERMLARAERNGNAVAVLFVDLDDFKLINDTLGHAVGDELLVAVADRLRGVVREADTLGRLGGDEFVVVAEATPASSGEAEIAARVGEAFDEPFGIDSQAEPLPMSASIGVAIAAPGSSPEQLLREADVAMYEAKVRGCGCMRFEPGMELALIGRAQQLLGETTADYGGGVRSRRRRSPVSPRVTGR